MIWKSKLFFYEKSYTEWRIQIFKKAQDDLKKFSEFNEAEKKFNETNDDEKKFKRMPPTL